MKELKRTKFVGFRVTADEYTKIENAAFASGHDPNDWCRAAAIGCSHHMLTLNDRLIYTEIAAFRHLLTHGFKLLLNGNPKTATAWTELTEEVDQRLEEILYRLVVTAQTSLEITFHCSRSDSEMFMLSLPRSSAS